MLYSLHEAQHMALAPWRLWAELSRGWFGHPFSPLIHLPLAKRLAASSELFLRVTERYEKPKWNIAEALPEVTLAKPFCNLVHFRQNTPGKTKVLLVAPLSGHYATLLRDTVRSLLPEHDVHITDWANARDVGIWHGRFGFDEYVEHLIWFVRAMGPGSHVVAVCQPCVQALAAAALMAEDDHPCQPLSLTLMAGPVDTRINPTKVNELATGQPISWFERNLIARVPLRYPGAARRIYPGFLQLTAFMSMNAERHVKAQVDLYKAMANNEHEQAKTIKD